ncbi:MAG: hypothetical protein Q8N23_28620 [Archangium sp.]|nr:hypothetical protein [Archangium sp.]MDP3570611.1 hypothetical protein [Archangium sp.]
MHLLRAVWFVLLLAPVAHAADEQCVVEPKVFKPQFASKLPRGFKLVSTRRDTKLITQVMKLPGGFEAKVTVAGCNNLTFTIGLKGPGLTTKTVGAELVAIARRILPTLPMDKDSTVDVKLISQALEEARINVMPAQLPCGDATCQLSLEGDDVKPPKSKSKKKDVPPAEPVGVLKLSYDLPL